MLAALKEMNKDSKKKRKTIKKIKQRDHKSVPVCKGRSSGGA
jgi:hypothetical protein